MCEGRVEVLFLAEIESSSKASLDVDDAWSLLKLGWFILGTAFLIGH